MRLHRLLFIFSLCLLTVVASLYSLLRHPKAQRNDFGSSEMKALYAIEDSDPIADLNKALPKKDYRFFGLYNMGGRPTYEVPGIIGENKNIIVKLKGCRAIQGTDVTYGDEHYRLMDVARQYGLIYNTRLLKFLLSQSSDPDIYRLLIKVENELRRYEKSNPAADFRLAIKKRSFRFIGLLNDGFPITGIADETIVEVSPPSYTFNARPLLGNDAIWDAKQRKRAQRIFQNYIVPYNTLLLNYLKKNAKWIQKMPHTD